MKFNNPYFSVREKIELLQRWILVHSYLYYELDNPVVEDVKYDKNSIQLMKYRKKYEGIYSRSKYYYAMKEFDGSTGFGFYQKLKGWHYDNIVRDANTVLRLKRERKI